MALEHTADGHGDGTRLLGDNHHHRIGVFAHAYTGPVPGSQIRTQPVTLGQGQHAAGSGNTAVPDNHSPVVEGGLGEEDVANQLLGNLAVDDGAGFEVLLQPAVPGEYDEGAHPLPAHHLAGPHRLGNDGKHLLLDFFPGEEPFQLYVTQVVNHPPQLRLEQHHQRQKANGQKLIDNETKGI